jgi:hypothetical protein
LFGCFGNGLRGLFLDVADGVLRAFGHFLRGLLGGGLDGLDDFVRGFARG